MRKSRATNQALADRFAACIARGMTQSDAYRHIRPRSRKWPDNSVAASATAFAKKELVVSAIDAALRNANVNDIISIGKWTAQTALLLKKAEEAGNLNAAQALNRQQGQACGALRENIVINQYDKQDDQAIIERLAKGDPAVAAMLHKVIGKPDFDS